MTLDEDDIEKTTGYPTTHVLEQTKKVVKALANAQKIHSIIVKLIIE